MAVETPIAPQGWYRRKLRNGNFSLEAQTECVPRDGYYYVLEAGQVAFQSRDFGEALQEYYKLCERWWREQLESKDPEEQLEGALGLLGLDVYNEEASDVLREVGRPADLKRLDQARNRARHAAKKKKALDKKERAKAAAAAAAAAAAS